MGLDGKLHGRKVAWGCTENPHEVVQNIIPLQLALARGYRWLRMLEEGKAKSLHEIAQKEKVDITPASRILNLILLVSDIVALILGDQMPEGISSFDLAVDAPAGWQEQRPGLPGSPARSNDHPSNDPEISEVP